MSPEFPVRVGFTGTHKGLTGAQRKSLLEVLNSVGYIVQAHHGDCVGADEEFHQLNRTSLRRPKYKEESSILHPTGTKKKKKGEGIVIYSHPPTDPKLRAFCKADITRPKKPYLQRNHEIVDETDFLIACPSTLTEQLRSGTWATVRYAKKIGRTVYFVFPDGSTLVEGTFFSGVKGRIREFPTRV